MARLPVEPSRSSAAPSRSSTAPSQSTPTRPARRNKNLTAVERQRIVESLLRLAVNDNLSDGVLSGVAAQHAVHPSTVSRQWQRAKHEAKLTRLYVAFSRMHLSGRRPTDHTDELEQLRGVDVAARSTVRAAAVICGLPQTTLQRCIGTGELRKVTSVVKPLLTEENRNTRLHFCVSHIDRDTLLYANMLNTVHVDEKIFHVSETTRRFLLLPGEVAPTRRVKSRRYITRVMVLAAVARPRVDTVTQKYFDGKLGVWAFVEKVPAQRSSRRRPAGTLEMKEVSVTKVTYRGMLTSRVLPAIEARWPNASEAVVIQQDNAPAHIKSDDPQFNDAAACCGRHVELRYQPANSPDLNVLDLGLFCAIQARQRKKIARTLDELIEAITESYWELPARTINAVFLSLQDSMDQCIQQRGDNAYKPRHMKKAKLEREGRLPLSIQCSDEAAVYLAGPAITTMNPSLFFCK